LKEHGDAPAPQAFLRLNLKDEAAPYKLTMPKKAFSLFSLIKSSAFSRFVD